MPKDLSPELNMPFWETWFLEEAILIPHTADSWACHSADALGLYLMGGEL